LLYSTYMLSQCNSNKCNSNKSFELRIFLPSGVSGFQANLSTWESGERMEEY
jgi:hypothetical protein